MFGMKFPEPVKKEKIVFSTGGGSIPANTTTFLQSLDQVGEASGGSLVTENSVFLNYLVTRSGTLRNLVVRCTAAPGVGQTFVYTVRVNGVPSTLTATISGVAIVATDLVNSVQVAIGDRVSLQVVTSLTAIVSFHATSFSFEINMPRLMYDHHTFGSMTATIAAGLTRYIGHTYKLGVGSGTVFNVNTYTRVCCLVVKKGTVKNFVVVTDGAPGVGQTFVYTVEVNGVATAITVTVSGAITVTGYDSTNVASVALGDRVTVSVVTSAGAAVQSHQVSFDFEDGDYRAG